MGGAEYIPAGGGTTFIGQTDTPSAYTGQGLRRPRVNDALTALEFDYDGVDVINVEEARSDIRSTTRAGYSAFSSYAGLQALVDAAGENKVFYFPANGIFDLGAGLNNRLKTKAIGQSLMSFGGGAEIKNGIIEINTRRCKLNNLRLTGASNYGIDITDPSALTAISGDPFQNWATFCRVRDVEIWDKVWGIYNNVASGLNRFYEVRTLNCTNGVYINHSDFAYDSGDTHFTECRISGSRIGGIAQGVGIHIVKHGGLALTDCKIMMHDINLLLEPDYAATLAAAYPPILGVYVTGCEFENGGTWDIKVTAGAGVNPVDYPYWFKMTGGTVMKILLEKSYQATISTVLIQNELRIENATTMCEIFGSPRYAITGTGILNTHYKLWGF